MATQIRKAAVTATARHRETLVATMEEAVVAYDRGRYSDAARGAKLVADEAPGVQAVRELAGLAAYRSGRWRDAVRHLEALSALGDGTDHVPALMDSYRALGRRARVSEQWSELRRRSPGADILAEARMVAAGTLADGGDLTGAIALLAGSGAAKALRNPADRHLRQWYALGDLYERAGDMPRARELFGRVARADPEAYDASERLEGLGPERPRRSRRQRPVAKERPGPVTRGRSGPEH
ncbi:MAG TPA: tetratricopeptide repeat protein [Acidimicrobiales bacterium]